MVKPRTKPYQQGIVEVFYGINRETKRVARVSRTRDGTLSMIGADLTVVTHHIIPGRDVKAEIAVVFHLTNVFGCRSEDEDEIFVKQKLKELEMIISSLGDH